MKVPFLSAFFLLSSLLFSQQADTLETKGAIIIASLEGQVTVVNNTTEEPLPASQVKAGGILFDGHTIKTGPASKVILLLSNGTVSTIKSDTSLNIKKFTQAKFDTKGKTLSKMSEEPSSSQTVLDLQLGDMVLDVKKLDKQSSFNIESPVGTAGIRGTIPYLQVLETKEGGFNQTTSMLEGELAFTPKGSDKPILLGPGDSLSLGILPNGVMMPPTFKTVSMDMMNSIKSDITNSAGATGVTSEDSPSPTQERRAGEVDATDEADQQEQKNDADAGRSARSSGADSNGSATKGALVEGGLITDAADDKAIVAVEAIDAAGEMFVSKQAESNSNSNGAQRFRRNSTPEKNENEFLADLTSNFTDVVDVTAEAESIGIDKSSMFNSLLENAENSGAVKEVVSVAAEIGAKDKSSLESVFTNVDQADAVKEVVSVAADLGAQDKDNLGAVFKNADKADDLKEVMAVAKETLGTDDGTGVKKLDTSKASILSSTLKNADKADSMKSVMEDAAALGAQDADNLTAVFANADKADDLKEVMAVAKETLGTDDGTGVKKLDTSKASILSSTLKNADKADSMKSVMEDAATLGAQDADNLTAVFANADKADDLKEVMAVAKETLGTDDGTGVKKLDTSKASILSSTLKNADKADSMKSVMEDAAALGAQDADNLTAVFANADKADDLKEVMAVAKETLGTDDGTGVKKLDTSKASILSSTLKNADKADSMKSVMEDAATLGAQDADNLTAVFANADKADDLKEVMAVAKENLGKDDGTGVKKFDTTNASVLTNTLKNADKATDLKEVVAKAETAGAIGSLDTMLSNADKATDLKEVVSKAESAGASASLGTMFANADKATDLKEVVAKAESAGASASLGTMFANADKATDLKEVVAKAESAGASASLGTMFANADKATDLKEVVAKAESAGASASLGTMFANADKATDLKEVVAKAESAGASASLGTMFANADKATDLKEVVAKAESAGASASLGTMFANADKATDLKEVVAKAESAGASASLGTMFANADKATDLKEVVAKAESAGASASLGTMFANADKATDLKEVVAKAESAGASASLGTMFANADKATDLKEVVAKAESAGASASLGTMFANADKATDLKEVVAKAESAGASASLGSMFENADRADEFKRVTDQLDSVGLEGGALDVFEQIESVADVFEAVAGDGNVDQTFAKNILGNAKEAGEVKKAIKLVQDNGGASNSAELLTFAQKDVSELKAINKVAEKFEGSGDALKAFVGEGLDQALQLEKAFEDGDIDASSIAGSVGTGGKFTDVVGNSVLEKLRRDYANSAEILEVINLNTDKAQDINFALSFVQPNSPQESALFANLDKISSIMRLSNRFETEPANLAIVYNNLDVASSLDRLVAEFSIYPSRLAVIMSNADMAPSILDYQLDFGLTPSMLSSSENLRSTLSNEGLASLLKLYPDFTDTIQKNKDIAGEINGLLSLAGSKYASAILSNLDKFMVIEVLVFRTKQDTKKLESLFDNLARITEIKGISDSLTKQNIPGGQDALFSNLNAFNNDPGYYLLAEEHPRFFVRLHELTGDLSKVPSTLAYELVVLDLSRSELTTVLDDLTKGPLSSGPTDKPPTEQGLSAEFAAVTILESHVFNGQIPANLVLSETQVRASNLFKETLDVFDALEALEVSQSSSSTASTSPVNVSNGLIGGASLTFNPGKYDLSSFGYDSFLFAASESLNFSGSISYSSTMSTEDLVFISAGNLGFSEGTVIDFSGDSLGFGSFDSLNVINVSLHAEGDIGLRSLDSIVINNSKFATKGSGADLIHLIAAADLSVDNLKFSEQIRNIMMEAMTINLSNLNFPNGSKVNLNSAYGGIDGIYPNFGSITTGRVNFIKNVQYNSNLIDSKATFDSHGQNITIGVLSR